MRAHPGRILIILALGAALAPPLAAQSRNGFLLAGYGSAGWSGAAASDPFASDFTASISPLMLYSVGENLLFEAELEFGLEGDATETSLEYAQIDYLGFGRLQLTAGKVLLPFGVFGERLHPSWINKLPTKPLIFGAGHGSASAESLLPVLGDAGLLLRTKQPIGDTWAFDVSAYVTQGPTDGVAGHDDEEPAMAIFPGGPLASEAGEGAEEGIAPPLMFGAAFGDNNGNKMVGARMGLVRGGQFEVYASGLTAKYDAESVLDYSAAALSAEFRRGGLEIRGEGVITRQEFEHEHDEFETLSRSGFYLQASHRRGSWEPVVRLSRVNDAKVAGAVVGEGHNELALGLDYWMASSVPLKFVWEFHEDRDSTFGIQWAFGF
ncbi:MAG: hypothetical protein AMXMBFR53_15090 [Gemmatimonadota bacterium]